MDDLVSYIYRKITWVDNTGVIGGVAEGFSLKKEMNNVVARASRSLIFIFQKTDFGTWNDSAAFCVQNYPEVERVFF